MVISASSLLFICSVSAQLITPAPEPPKRDAVLVARASAEYSDEFCSNAFSSISECASLYDVSEYGVTYGDIAATAPGEFFRCACCGFFYEDDYAGCYRENYSLVYSGLTAGEAFGTFVDICGAEEFCTATFTEGASEVTETDEFEATLADDITTMTDELPTTSSMPDACTSLTYLTDYCAGTDDFFLDLQLNVQAKCYCCSTSAGKLVQSDYIKDNGRDCTDWAITNSPDLFNYARSVADICVKYSDACDDPSASQATATGEPTENKKPAATPATSTRMPKSTATDKDKDKDNAASGITTAVARCLVIAALVIAYL